MPCHQTEVKTTRSLGGSPYETQASLTPDKASTRPAHLAGLTTGPDHATTVNAHAAWLTQAQGERSAQTKQGLLQMQRQYGNHHVQRVMQQVRGAEGPPQTRRPLIQAKLMLAPAGDKYE